MPARNAIDLPLGKKLGVVHDPRTIKAASILKPAEVKVPNQHRIAAGLHEVPVFGNDKLGDCTQASIGHAIVTMERSSGQSRTELPVTEDQIVQAYEIVGGYRPGHPETDNGAYELDSLNNWRNRGIGAEHDFTTHRIKAFAAVDWHNRGEVLRSHYVFGGLKVCAALPLTASDQLDAGDPWSLAEDFMGRADPGSWGGHSMYSFAYDRHGLYVWTWGRQQAMSWAWVDRYVDECYCVISEDYLRRGGSTPQGFDEAALDEQIARIS